MNRKFMYFATIAAVFFVANFFIACANRNAETERNKQIVIESLKLIQDSSYDGLNKYYAEDYARHCQATPNAVVKSLDDFKALLLEWDKTFTDIVYKTQVTIAEGDLVAFYGRFSATQTGQMGPFPPTGKRMSTEFAGYHRIADEKIAETWVTWDNMVSLQQLGLFPAPPGDDGSRN